MTPMFQFEKSGIHNCNECFWRLAQIFDPRLKGLGAFGTRTEADFDLGVLLNWESCKLYRQ